MLLATAKMLILILLMLSNQAAGLNIFLSFFTLKTPMAKVLLLSTFIMELTQYQTRHSKQKKFITEGNSSRIAKSAAKDTISNEMLKFAVPIILAFLAILFNNILETQKYPGVWSISIITNILRSGGVANSDNYQRITITS